MDFVTFSKSKHVMLRSDLPDNRQLSHQAKFKQQSRSRSETRKPEMFSQVSAEVAKPSTAKEEEEKILLLVGTPLAKSFCQC